MRTPSSHSIVIVTRGDVFPPDHGAAAKIVRTARGLAERGHRVYLASNDRAGFHAIHRAGHVSYPFPTALRMHIPVLAPTVDQLKRFVVSHGVPADDHFLFSPLFDPHFSARVMWLAREVGATILQAEFPGYAGPAFAAATSRHGAARTVLVEHNVEFDRMQGTVAGITKAALDRVRLLELAACNLSDAIVTCSQPDVERLAEHGIDRARMFVVPHGVDIENYPWPVSDAEWTARRWVARARFGLAADDLVLCFHGVMSYPPNREAGEVLLQQIVPRLRARGLRPKVLLMGRYPPAIDDPDFIVPGSVLDLPKAIPAADIACVPLLGGGGTRLKILEYFASGVPCVSTAKGAEGIVVEDGRELLIRDDWDAFADSVMDLHGNPARGRALALAGRQFVEQFSWGRIAERYAAVFEHTFSAPHDAMRQAQRRARVVRALTDLGRFAL